MNTLFELNPIKRLAEGFPAKNDDKEVVCLITHKRSFDQPMDEGQEVDQCVMRIEQKHGFIYDFDSNDDPDEKPGPHDWFYEIKY